MNFECYNPTHLIFGVGGLSSLGEVAREHGTRALLGTGDGSVKRSGVFDPAVAGLEASGRDRAHHHDENGLPPGRPPMSKEDIETVMRAAL